MGSNAANDVIMSGGDEAEGSETTVEIKIKTLDSQTYTLRVNKCVPVPALKEQIAIVTGVLSEQQRLICRGKILKDDQLLSAYHVEDGHTLHLVVRQPIHSPSPLPTSFMGSEGSSGLPATNSASSSVRNLGNHVAHSFVFETVNLADQGDPVAPELGRFLSSILNSIGVGTPSTGTDETRTEYRELGSERLGRASGDTAPSDTTQPQSNPAAPRFGFDPRQASFRFPSAVPFGSQHPAVIPDSLTTLYQYLSHMRNEFRREGFRDNGTENSSNSEAVDVHGREGQNQNSQTRSAASGQGGLPTPASLAEIALSTRQLLLEQAGRCLSQLARQLEDQTSVIDPQMRMNIQSSVMRSGVLLQDLGSLLLELGRTTMTLCIGQTPSEAVVNAGPAVFISPSGPNPMMVQPVPFYPGSSFGGIHMGNVNPGRSVEGEPLGSAFLPRNIDIRIRTGHTPPAATANLGEQGSAQQSQGQTDPARNSAGASFLHEALSGVPGGASFTGESGVRVVPIRTVVAVPSGVNRSPSNSSGNTVGLLYPLLARVQHLNAGTVNDARGSEASTEPHSGGSEIVSDPIVESALRSQNLESNNDGANRSSNNASTNSAPVVPGTSPSPNESAQYQGSFRIFISSQQRPSSNNNDSSTQAPDVQQIGDGSVPQMFSRLDQLFRAVRPAEQIPAGDTSRLGSVTGSAADQTGLTRDAEAQEASRVGHNQGIFFSSLVRELMPFISQSPAPEGVSPTNPGSSTTQAEREDLTDSSSQHLRDPPEAPNSKRPKLE